MLSFFFDGVPNPADAVAADDSEELSDTPVVGKARPVSTASMHPRKGGWACRRCHSSFSNQLKGSVEELCKQCHTRDKFPEGKLHGPLNVGKCTACHDPHRSSQGHLVRLPVPELCMQCHEKKLTFQRIEQHIEDKGSACVRCHNPHASRHSPFLREVYLQEGFLYQATLGGEPRGADAGPEGAGSAGAGSADAGPVGAAPVGADAGPVGAAPVGAGSADAGPVGASAAVLPEPLREP